jgi:hypothetical protein
MGWATPFDHMETLWLVVWSLGSSAQWPLTEPLASGVLCKINGNQYLHLVKAVQGDRVLSGNNRGGVNGWTSQVYGKLVKVDS